MEFLGDLIRVFSFLRLDTENPIRGNKVSRLDLF